MENNELKGPKFEYGLHYGEVILADWLSKHPTTDIPARFYNEYGLNVPESEAKLVEEGYLEKSDQPDQYQLTAKGQELLEQRGFFVWGVGKEEFLLKPADFIRYGEFKVKPPYARVGSQALDDKTILTSDLSQLATYEDALSRLFKSEGVIPGVVERAVFSYVLEYLGLSGTRTAENVDLHFSAKTPVRRVKPIITERLGKIDLKLGIYDFIGQRFIDKYGKLFGSTIKLTPADIAKMVEDDKLANDAFQRNRERFLKSHAQEDLIEG